MARAVVTNTRRVEEQKLSVWLNGSPRPDVIAARMIRRWGLNPDQLLLVAPSWYVEENANLFDGAEVSLWQEGNASPLFRGYIDVDSRDEDANSSRVVYTASNIIGLLDQVFVGENEDLAVVRYLRRDMRGEETGLTLSSIVEDLFSIARFPSDWRAKIQLGNVSAIKRVENDLNLPDIVFTSDSYRDALRIILAHAGRVTVSARYDAVRTLLDFHVVNDSLASTREIACTTAALGPEHGRVVVAMSHHRDGSQRRTVARGLGRNDEIMLTVSSILPNDTGGLGEPLLPAWEGATGYGGLHENGNDDLTENELRVIANPDRAVPGRPGHAAQYEDIFRKFRLPESVRSHTIVGLNALVRVRTMADGTPARLRFPTQFWRQKYEYGEFVGTDGLAYQGSVATDDWELVRGARIEDGYVIFPTPMVDVCQYRIGAAGEEVRVYRRVHVYVTLTILHNARALSYTTSDQGVETVMGLAPTFQFKNNNVVNSRIGTTVEELLNGSGVGWTFDAQWYDEDLQEWRSQATPGVPEEIESDRMLLAGIAEASVAEQRKRPSDVRVALPGIWSGFAVGQMARVLGRGFDNLRLQIQGIGMDLLRPSTSLLMSNAVPRWVSSLAGSWARDTLPFQMRGTGNVLNTSERLGRAVPRVAGWDPTSTRGGLNGRPPRLVPAQESLMGLAAASAMTGNGLGAMVFGAGALTGGGIGRVATPASATRGRAANPNQFGMGAGLPGRRGVPDGAVRGDAGGWMAASQVPPPADPPPPPLGTLDRMRANFNQSMYGNPYGSTGQLNWSERGKQASWDAYVAEDAARRAQRPAPPPERANRGESMPEMLGATPWGGLGTRDESGGGVVWGASDAGWPAY